MNWTLYNGRAQDVLPGAYVGAIDLIVCSPPYDNMREYGGGQAAWDFDAVADALVPTLSRGGVLCWVVADQIVDGAESGTSFRQCLGFVDRGLGLHQTLIYQRWNPNGMAWDRYYREHEYIFVLSKDGRPRVANLLCDRKQASAGERQILRKAGAGAKGDYREAYAAADKNQWYIRAEYGRRSTIWRYDVGGTFAGSKMGRVGEARLALDDHPAVFPYALASDLIQSWSEPGDLVCDPLAGSGTTLRAAADLGRRALGVEVNSQYCELIQKRMAQGVLL